MHNFIKYFYISNKYVYFIYLWIYVFDVFESNVD